MLNFFNYENKCMGTPLCHFRQVKIFNKGEKLSAFLLFFFLFFQHYYKREQLVTFFLLFGMVFFENGAYSGGKRIHVSAGANWPRVYPYFDRRYT